MILFLPYTKSVMMLLLYLYGLYVYSATLFFGISFRRRYLKQYPERKNLVIKIMLGLAASSYILGLCLLLTKSVLVLAGLTILYAFLYIAKP